MPTPKSGTMKDENKWEGGLWSKLSLKGKKFSVHLMSTCAIKAYKSRTK